MAEIEIDPAPQRRTLAELGVFSWPIWAREVSTFPWQYAEAETCYFLEGDVVVTPDGGNPVRVGKGQPATFPAATSCVWDIRSPVRKHYRFS